MLDARRIRRYHVLKAELAALPPLDARRPPCAKPDAFDLDDEPGVLPDGPIIQPRDGARSDAAFYEHWRKRRA